MSINKSRSVETQMLIRKPAEAVFQAFIDPDITRHFWFTKGSDVLEPGKRITWEWEMYNVSTQIIVQEIEKNKRILIAWDEPPTTVEFNFTSLAENKTYVVIKNYGFTQEGDQLLDVIKDSTGGFTTVLDGLKAYLEHGIKLNLIADKFPSEMIKHGQ